jgi:hypothetical protein
MDAATISPTRDLRRLDADTLTARANNEVGTRADADNAVLTRAARGHTRTHEAWRGIDADGTRTDAD